MYEFCKACVDKKHNVGTVIDLEVADLQGTNNNNTIIANKRPDMLHKKSDEGSILISNGRYDI